MELQTWLVEGWDTRTQQKLAVAGCLAAALSLRSSPLRTGSKLREFVHKIGGYGGAALLFSGVQETSRAARGRHDFLNSAVSGGITGAVVVGHYQGPQYRLLGLLTWASVCGVLHLGNSLLQPRHLLEDYLIREGLLSPKVALMREAAAAAAAAAAGTQGGLQRFEHRDVLLDSLSIRDREMQQLNDRLAAAARRPGGAAPSAAAAPSSAGPQSEELRVDDIADDDEGYLAWLRNSGFEAEALLNPGEERAAGSSGSSSGSGNGSEGAAGVKRPVGEEKGGSGGAAAPAPAEGGAEKKKRTWREWLGRWSWRRSKTGATGSGGSSAGGEEPQQ